MTKEQLKIMHSVPMPDEFLSEEDYIAAKTAWIAVHPDEYAEIIAAPHDQVSHPHLHPWDNHPWDEYAKLLNTLSPGVYAGL